MNLRRDDTAVIIGAGPAGSATAIHLARAGWVRWRDELPTTPPRPSNKSPLAVRIELDDGTGIDVTEAGTKNSLALYVVREPGVVIWHDVENVPDVKKALGELNLPRDIVWLHNTWVAFHDTH